MARAAAAPLLTGLSLLVGCISTTSPLSSLQQCAPGPVLASLLPPPQRITKHGDGQLQITSAWRIALEDGNFS
eukprot:COSAG06_NODE_20127_length_807_cov_1.015537_1_plen_72_part_10